MSKIDNDKRSANVIITGVPEETSLKRSTDLEEVEEAVGDEQKVKMIFAAANCPTISFKKIERLGEVKQDDHKRPMKVVLDDPSNRADIMNGARNLKSAGVDFKRVYIKKDTNPHVRKELARLRDVVKREKDKPENTGKSIYYDYKQKKVFVDETAVDSFAILPF